MDGLNTVLEYLTSVPAWYLATSVDGQPHVRPFSFAQIQDGKLVAGPWLAHLARACGSG